MLLLSSFLFPSVTTFLHLPSSLISALHLPLQPRFVLFHFFSGSGSLSFLLSLSLDPGPSASIYSCAGREVRCGDVWW